MKNFIIQKIKKDKASVISMAIFVLIILIFSNIVRNLTKYPVYMNKLYNVEKTYKVKIDMYNEELKIEQDLASVGMMNSSEKSKGLAVEIIQDICDIKSENFEIIMPTILEKGNENFIYVDKNHPLNKNIKLEKNEVLVSATLKEKYQEYLNINSENKKIKGYGKLKDIILEDLSNENSFLEDWVLVRKDLSDFSVVEIKEKLFLISKDILVEVKDSNELEKLRKILMENEKIKSVNFESVREQINFVYYEKYSFTVMMIILFGTIIGLLVLIAIVILKYINLKGRKLEFKALKETIGYSINAIRNAFINEQVFKMCASSSIAYLIFIILNKFTIDIIWTIKILLLLLGFEVIVSLGLFIFIYDSVFGEKI